MGKKSTLKKLRRIAKKLPVEMQQTFENHIVTGVELKQEGFDKKQKPFDETESYLRKYPVLLQVNHNRRIKKIYKKFGLPGIEKYVKQVIERNGTKEA